jgi:hypothetical protein
MRTQYYSYTYAFTTPFHHSVTLTIRKKLEQILGAGHHVHFDYSFGRSANTNLDVVHPNRRVIFLDNAVPIPFLNDPTILISGYQLGCSV